MTKEKFFKEYAERSGVSVEDLETLGQVAVPCDCGRTRCPGWQVVSRELVEEQTDAANDTTNPEEKTFSFTLTEAGCGINRPSNVTLDDLKAVCGTLMCVILVQHLRKGEVADAISWRNQCFDAMTAFVSDHIDGTAQATDFFSSAVEEESKDLSDEAKKG